MLGAKLRLVVFATLLIAACLLGSYLGMRSWQPSLANLNEHPPHETTTTESDQKATIGTWWDWTKNDAAGFYTFVLDILTGAVCITGAALSLYTYRLWGATIGTLELARKEFSAAHRPEIIVRNMHMSGDDVVFMYYNLGRDRARNIQIEAAIFSAGLREKIQPNRTLIDCTPNKTALDVGSFGIATAIPTDDDMMSIGYDLEDRLEKNESAVHCVGMVRYEDSRGLKRQMGFVRWLDPKTGRFSPIDDEEYEYSY